MSGTSKKVINKILVVLLHLCGWTLVLTAPFRFLTRNSFFRSSPPPEPPPDGGPDGFRPERFEFNRELIFIESGVSMVLLAAFFYLNVYVLIPRVLTKKGWVPYLAIVVSTFFAYSAIGYGLRWILFTDPHMIHPSFFMGVPNFLIVLAISLSLRLIQDRKKMEDTLNEQENEKLKSELSFLRSQVSPHFIFNVLNGVAALARKKSDKVEESIIQLSSLMRYSLYTGEHKVSVEQEAGYIENYIQLMRLRFGSGVSVNYHADIKQEQVKIEPMLLVPFVENAFKHGIGLIQDPVIDISLHVAEHKVEFVVKNKFNPTQNETKDASSGIGLQNVRRRLDLLYPDMYSLHTGAVDGNWFVSQLTLIAQ